METRLRERARAYTCSFCHDELGGETWTCPGCHTAQHLECARENKRCTSLGCGRRVHTARRGVSASLLLVGLVAVISVGPMLVAPDASGSPSVAFSGSIAALAVLWACTVSLTRRRAATLEVPEGPTLPQGPATLPVVEASPPPLPLPVASISPGPVEAAPTTTESASTGSEALGCAAVLAVPGLALLAQQVTSVLDAPWSIAFDLVLLGAFALTGLLVMRRRPSLS
jgi:hypothetical protein